jgi:hypothetical protein
MPAPFFQASATRASAVSTAQQRVDPLGCEPAQSWRNGDALGAVIAPRWERGSGDQRRIKKFSLSPQKRRAGLDVVGWSPGGQKFTPGLHVVSQNIFKYINAAFELPLPRNIQKRDEKTPLAEERTPTPIFFKNTTGLGEKRGRQ